MLELAVAKDRDAVNALAQQVHQMHVAWRPDIFENTAELYTEARFLEAIKARELYVAKLGDMIAGYVLITIRTCDHPGTVKRRVMLLEELCVDRSFRRHGIGRQIMEEVKLLARAFGCTDIQLCVYPQNAAAIALYESMGMDVKSIQYQMTL